MKKLSYSKDVDIFTIELASGVIDYATEAGQFIIHFSKQGKPLVIEVQDASKLLDAFESAVRGEHKSQRYHSLKDTRRHG